MRAARWRTSTPTACAACAAWVLGANTELPRDISVSLGAPGAGALSRPLLRRGAHLPLPDPQSRSRARRCCARRARVGTPPLDARAHARRPRRSIGEHDFSAFRSAECQAQSPVRRMERLERRAPRRLGRDRGHRQRLPAPHGAQHRRAADRASARARRRPPGRRGARRAATARASAATAPAAGLYLWQVRYPAAFGAAGAAGRRGPAPIGYDRACDFRR